MYPSQTILFSKAHKYSLYKALHDCKFSNSLLGVILYYYFLLHLEVSWKARVPLNTITWLKLSEKGYYCTEYQLIGNIYYIISQHWFSFSFHWYMSWGTPTISVHISASMLGAIMWPALANRMWAELSETMFK